MLVINIISILLSQTDKILLSKLVPLDQFGYYTLAGTVAGIALCIYWTCYQRYVPTIYRTGCTSRRNKPCIFVSFKLSICLFCCFPYLDNFGFFSKRASFFMDQQQYNRKKCPTHFDSYCNGQYAQFDDVHSISNSNGLWLYKTDNCYLFYFLGIYNPLNLYSCSFFWHNGRRFCLGISK